MAYLSHETKVGSTMGSIDSRQGWRYGGTMSDRLAIALVWLALVVFVTLALSGVFGVH